MFKECFSDICLFPIKEKLAQVIFDPVPYQPPPSQGPPLQKAHVPHSANHNVCVPCQFSKAYAMRKHCIFLLQNMHFLTSKYAFIAIMLAKMIPLFF